ncbi:chemotaxis protein MotA [Erythromicrobium ramosum]|uniref:Chemotaxis protein MotA n=1 Tax=Erythrobacter ramosus TaxID=35811 RepID=A0A6I4UFR0_9SPHN|nr:MotA/TolQ/ExbB proton channel family protein [Erythrobacter ramosus]MBB3774385.1 chemotaxis protein MotA [Erythrobacter ramosus]MXP37961.1 chemotaxis protein MotA [Erythrobacter ramosus]
MPPALPNLSHLFDPGSLGIVVVGTVLATVARCGWRDFGAAIKVASGLVRRPFQIEANRKALAKALSAIQRDGHHRADPALPPDRALSLMLETYLRHGAPEALGQVRRAERALDEARRVSAAQVFVWSGELAPVFGLIGTLYGLAQIDPAAGADATAMIMGAVSSAVLTSLYGALLAHLVCYPLASAIERRGLIEEQNRETLAEWFIAQIDLTDVAANARRAHLREVT